MKIVKLIQQLACKYSSWQVFSDFLEMFAVSISNVIDPVHREDREKCYMETIQRYSKEDLDLFPQMLAELISELELCVQDGHLEDVLGCVFHELELHNKYQGQFFTPQSVADMMGMVTAGNGELPEKGYLTVSEPCIGSGVMVMGLVNALKNVNHCSQIVVTGVDIDLKCVHMAYLQLSLYGIPAVIIHGNTLTCEEWSRWYTPSYIMGGWLFRERCGITTANGEDEQMKCAFDPQYRAFRTMDSLFPKTNSEKIIEEPAYTVSKRGQLSLF